MYFTHTDSPCPLTGELVYVQEDHAFQTIPTPPMWNSVTVNTFEVFLDIQGVVTGGGGYCPHQGWKKKALTIPDYVPGRVKCHGFPSFDKQIPRNVDDATWGVYYDSVQRWICFGHSSEETKEECSHIEVLKGFVLGFDKKGMMKTIWIEMTNCCPFNNAMS